VPLTSINKDAFDSYGLSGLGCAAVSPEAADAYEKALNRLLAGGYPSPVDGSPLPVRNFRLSEDTVVVFWGKGHDDAIDLFADSVGQGQPEAVQALYQATWKGRPIDLGDPSAFYALTLSGGQGRGTIRGWLETTLGHVLGNVKRYFVDLEIVRPKGEEGKPLPLLGLLRQTAVLGKLSNIAPNLAADLFDAVLADHPFPRALLDAAVRRARAERAVFPDRAALLKAYLLRARRAGLVPTFPEVQPMLDESCPDRAYRLGRLFAVLEKVQQEATSASATIRDRYYGAASATPVVVFPQLLRKAPHHLPKSTRPQFFEKLLQEICDPLVPPAPFPHTLTLEQQGLFAVGYYHERQALFDEKLNRRRNERFFPKAVS
jgi:CRISPR-associated protein Csd1